MAYEGGSYSNTYLGIVGSYLITSLFYLELTASPKFYHSPDVCCAMVRCRIPSGGVLLSLLKRLQNDGACLISRGDELDYCRTTLCGSDTMLSCREGKPFGKCIQMRVNSPSSILDVQIVFSNGVRRTISKLPCVLGTLIEEERLTLCTISKNVRKGTQFGNNESGDVWPQTEFERLQTALHQFTQKYN